MKKIIVISVIMLIISGLLLAPSVTASQIDLTPEEKIETWLNNNLELSDPERTLMIELILVFIEWMRIFFGEDLGLLLGMSIVGVFVFIPFLAMSCTLGLPTLVNCIDTILEEIEFNWEEFIDAIGIIGIAILFIITLPISLIFCFLLYPVCVVGTFIGLYAELYEYIANAFI